MTLYLNNNRNNNSNHGNSNIIINDSDDSFVVIREKKQRKIRDTTSDRDSNAFSFGTPNRNLSSSSASASISSERKTEPILPSTPPPPINHENLPPTPIFSSITPSYSPPPNVQERAVVDVECCGDHGIASTSSMRSSSFSAPEGTLVSDLKLASLCRNDSDFEIQTNFGESLNAVNSNGDIGASGSSSSSSSSGGDGSTVSADGSGDSGDIYNNVIVFPPCLTSSSTSVDSLPSCLNCSTSFNVTDIPSINHDLITNDVSSSVSSIVTAHTPQRSRSRETPKRSRSREGKENQDQEEVPELRSSRRSTLMRTDSVLLAEMNEPRIEKKPFKTWLNFVLTKGATVMGLSLEDDYTGKKKQAEYAFGTGVWALVRTANLESLARKLKNKPQLARLRGPVGETMLHLCFLYDTPEHHTMARYLMQEFPWLIYECYDGEDYYGENCLHVALIKQNTQMVEELLQRSAADDTRLLKAQATGRFFSRGRPCYYGEFPLFFAACTSQKDMVDRLLLAGAQLDERDSNGNTVLHLLVIHGLPDMYSYMMEKWKIWKANSRIIKRGQPLFDLWHIYNNEKLTPFTLAAELNNKVMFEFILSKRVQLHWEYGPVKCVLYPLEELDIPLEFEQHSGSSQQHLYSTLHPSPSTDRTGRVPSALEIIVQRAHVSLLMSPRVQEILDKKWERFAGRVFATRFFLTLCFLSIFTTTLVLSPSRYPQLARAGELIVLIVALYSGAQEIYEMASWGLGNYWRVPGSGFLENSLIVCFASSISGILMCRCLSEDRNGALERNLLALASVLAWSYVLYFLLAFRLTGHFVVMIYKMLATDMLRFCMIFVTFLLGFSQAFFVLFEFQGAGGVLESLLLCFKAMLGEVDFDTKFTIVPTLFMVVYIIVVAILLFNLLIAMMGDTYTNVNEAADAQWYLERARIIFAIEKKMSTKARTKAQNTYWTTIESVPEGADAPMIRRYLQIEQVNQDHFTPTPTSLAQVSVP